MGGYILELWLDWFVAAYFETSMKIHEFGMTINIGGCSIEMTLLVMILFAL